MATNFLFTLCHDDNTAATRCFQFARIAHSKGYAVNIFFIDNGVMWANKNRDIQHQNRHRGLPGGSSTVSGGERSPHRSLTPVRQGPSG